MASRAVRITIEDMRPLFQKKSQDGRGWEESIQGNSEIVFDFPYTKNCTLRVWTSIHTGTEASAGVGKDAIRVVAFDPINNRGLMKCPIVMRTTNWRDNLKARLQQAWKDLPGRLRWAETHPAPSAPASTDHLRGVQNLAAEMQTMRDMHRFMD